MHLRSLSDFGKAVIPMAEGGGRMLKLLAYLREGQSRPIALPEFKEFWQACSEAERIEFCEDAGV